MRRRGGMPTPGGAIATREVKAMIETVPSSKSRKVNGYVKAVLALETIRRKREERYDRYVRPLDRKRDTMAATSRRTGGRSPASTMPESKRILASMGKATSSKHGATPS